MHNEGLDFLLQTKEFGEESKITIHLLLLRKLVDSGEFDSALQTMTNIHAEVRKEKLRKNEILEELSFGKVEGYRAYARDVHKRFEDEDTLFHDTMEFLKTTEKEYINKIDRELMNEKDKKFLLFIRNMQDALLITLNLHGQLLHEVVDLRKQAEAMHLTKRRNIFKEHLNFATLLDKLMSNNRPDKLHSVLSPFFKTTVSKDINPKRVNDILLWRLPKEADKPITNEQGETIEKPPSIDAQIEGRIAENLKTYLYPFLMCLQEGGGSCDLADFKDYMEENYGEDVLKNRDLGVFVISLTRTIEADSKEATAGKSKSLDYRTFKLDTWGETKIEGIYPHVIDTYPELSDFKDVIIQSIVPACDDTITIGDMFTTNIQFKVMEVG